MHKQTLKANIHCFLVLCAVISPTISWLSQHIAQCIPLLHALHTPLMLLTHTLWFKLETKKPELNLG